APLVRLKLAEILLRQHRPAQARSVLAKIPPGTLTPQHETYRRKLEQLADRTPVGNVIEMAPQDW
ncbi:MAG TPA: hypothetical protein VJL29_06100, partial [Thermoguttaceae bacterium]|nr:hypothetical protein [Thermoguttaceae bacterium]